MVRYSSLLLPFTVPPRPGSLLLLRLGVGVAFVALAHARVLLLLLDHLADLVGVGSLGVEAVEPPVPPEVARRDELQLFAEILVGADRLRVDVHDIAAVRRIRKLCRNDEHPRPTADLRLRLRERRRREIRRTGAAPQ